MPYDHPQTPQSPSQTSSGAAADRPTKSTKSPRSNDSLLTPAHSINGSMPSNNLECPHDGDGKPEAKIENDLCNKRKRDPEDNGGREQKKVHVEDSIVGIDALHIEVGPKYLFLQTPHPVEQPNTAIDLFALYDLEPIAKFVERFKPDGTKSVKMRKSFKNKVKELGVSGNFDIPISKDPPKPGSLFSMMEAPQEEWDGAHTRGKEIAKGFDSVLPNLGKALMMAKGVIPKSKWDSSVLGEVAAPAAAKAVPVQNGARTPVPNPGVARAKSELPRPKRNVKKRTYQDSSYEGYGEGYVDDESHETGYSTNDGDDRGAAKKRPKKNSQGHFTGPPPRQNSYGPGMVGA